MDAAKINILFSIIPETTNVDQMSYVILAGYSIYCQNCYRLYTLFFVINILTLDISFTSGIANGYIFFAQVIDSFATNANGFIIGHQTIGMLS